MIYHGAGDGKIGTSAFKSDYGRTEYVGLKYTIGSQYGTDINSNIYNELDLIITEVSSGDEKLSNELIQYIKTLIADME